jgi:Family of unknown function (DUF5631)/Family of unknown function (DUF5632)
MSSVTNGADPWFQAMVGQWWTPPSDLAVVGAAATKRQATSTAWQHFSDQLHQQLSSSLSPELQKGMAADSIREAFTWGAEQAGGVAQTNSVISGAHHSAQQCVHDLNSRLETIANNGKTEIQQIQESKDLPPIKLGKIVEVVMRCQQDANSAAAPSTQSVFEAMQNILDQRGIPVNARQFAQQHGIDTTRMLGSPSKEAVTQQVQGLLSESGPGQTTALNDGLQPIGGGAQNAVPQAPATAAGEPPASEALLQPVGPGLAGAGVPPPAQTQSVATGGQLPVGPGIQGVPSVGPASAVGGPPPSPSGLSSLPTANTSLPTNALTSAAPSNAFGQSPLSVGQPNAFMQGFDHGLNQGAPTSAALNNVPPVTGPVQPQVPVQPPVSDVPASTGPATAPAVDAPPSTAAPSVSSHSAVTDSGTAYLAGSAAAAPSAPAAPIGSLPTYGSDIRPPMPTISAPTLPSGPAATPSVSSAASPASAPVSPSAGAGGLAQPVVRQPTAAPLAHPAPAGIGEQAVAAAAGGAAAGAASAQATAKTRLQRLVDFVAHQEPRLRWTAGEQADGTTVLVTDLASGWIPPGIALPSVVTLLDPGDRRGDIEALLGQASASASYTPLHYLPESADDAEPIPTSPRPRQVPAVDELGWELGQATNWRDGLPQMAHTLAKAASTGTGVVDNEVEFLHQHLATLRGRVLDAYPDDVDGAAVANWQLLASIEALAASDSIGANYHFAWFQALNYVP